MTFRKEKKFRLSKSHLKLLKSSLILKGMKVLHPERQINSCYFDTKNLKTFFDSENGVLPRKKFRYRWYNNYSIINKEIKISSIEGRFKISNNINKYELEKLKKLKIYDCDYGNLYSQIIIKYKREYFIYENLRITFDTNIEYENLTLGNKYKSFEKEVVMAVKAPITQSENYIES